jgi:peroxiredoxin
MPRISINTPAPDFTLLDYTGKPVSLSDYRGQIVLLVFNRTFA